MDQGRKSLQNKALEQLSPMHSSWEKCRWSWIEGWRKTSLEDTGFPASFQQDTSYHSHMAPGTVGWCIRSLRGKVSEQSIQLHNSRWNHRLFEWREWCKTNPGRTWSELWIQLDSSLSTHR